MVPRIAHCGVEVVTRRDLADLGIAEVGVMLGAAGDVELKGLDRRQREVDIGRIVLAGLSVVPAGGKPGKELAPSL